MSVGDAPVHSMAAALFASRDQTNFFDDIGYQHDPYTHCTNNKESWRKDRCTCDPTHSFGKITSLLCEFFFPDYDGYSCKRKWDLFTEGDESIVADLRRAV